LSGTFLTLFTHQILRNNPFNFPEKKDSSEQFLIISYSRYACKRWVYML